MSAATALLESTNRSIGDFLKSFPPGDASAWNRLPSAEEVQSLAARLEQVDRVIRNQPELRATSRGKTADLVKYTENLEKLLAVLLQLQPVLLAQRSRLESDRQHLAATGAWTSALKQTR